MNAGNKRRAGPAAPAVLRVKVIPKASRDELAGWMGDVLKIRVTAPPERGRANAAVVDLLATALGVAASRLRLLAGGSTPNKTIAVDALSADEVRERLQRVLRDRTERSHGETGAGIP